MMKVAYSVVTGAGSGIGRALAVRLGLSGNSLALIGRREDALEETRLIIRNEMRAHGGSQDIDIKVIPCDIGCPSGIQLIESQLQLQHHPHTPHPVRHLVHNAGTIQPLMTLDQVTPQQWRTAFCTNVDGPLFLTQALTPNLIANGPGARVLFVGSGAAHKPYHSWGAYCSSKAAFHMMWNIFKTENQHENIAFGSVRPGVVDTPMQGEIRASTIPTVQFFKDLKHQDTLTSVSEVGEFIHFLLQNTNQSEFQQDEWDIRDLHHRHRWYIE
ncbi:hypothetical protein AAMO2058_000079900 [Amorphochlora amoebiformis]